MFSGGIKRDQWKKQSSEGVLKKISKIHRKTPVSGSLIKKETLAQVFFCEFCEISKDIFFIEQAMEAASAVA